MTSTPTGTTSVDERMVSYNSRAQPFIVVAAIAPFVVAMIANDARDGLFLFVDLASWGIFVVDLVVRTVIDRKYLKSGNGIFDLAIVLLTFPWYIMPFGDTAAFMSVFRLARLARLFTATDFGSRGRVLFDRLGKLGLALVIVSVFSALVVINAEPPESGFENFGDALWWATVSFTTVGYGDLYPTTALGRFAGLLMMMAGLAALGTVSAVLADMFRGQSTEGEDQVVQDLLEEVKTLRREVAALNGGAPETMRPGEEADG